jgi:hypothetical protein
VKEHLVDHIKALWGPVEALDPEVYQLYKEGLVDDEPHFAEFVPRITGLDLSLDAEVLISFLYFAESTLLAKVVGIVLGRQLLAMQVEPPSTDPAWAELQTMIGQYHFLRYSASSDLRPYPEIDPDGSLFLTRFSDLNYAQISVIACVALLSANGLTKLATEQIVDFLQSLVISRGQTGKE